MKPIRFSARRLLVALALVFGAGPYAVGAAGQEAARPLAFTNVNVVPMDRERILENQTVVVQGDRIGAVGGAASIPVPADARRIDGRGKYLMPGLAEMHAHIPPPQAEEAYGAGYVENVLFLYVASGITTVRGMLGHPAHLELRRRVVAGEIIGPTIYTAGPSFSGSSVPTVEVARRMVTEQKAAGYDFLKIHPGLSREVFDTMVAVASRVGIHFAGHVPAAVGLRRALEARYASIDHLDGYLEMLVADGASPNLSRAGFFGSNLVRYVDEEKIAGLASATRDAGVWLIPTQVLIENFATPEDPESLARRPEMRYVPAAMLRDWVRRKAEFMGDPGYSPETGRRFIEIRAKLIKALHDARVPLALGSDAPQVFNVPGFSALRELRAMVAAGLTPYQALAMGTRNVAVYFNALDRAGTVEAGKVADLLLVDGNPIADVGNVERRAGVMLRGRWLPDAEIRSRLEAMAAGYRTGAAREEPRPAHAMGRSARAAR
ncbi:MAG: amidohydrolase family protein [Gemmatimonadetes bacterium]|nr:amidohydrolase family protein [Gemmatimonadota bacterium]